MKKFASLLVLAVSMGTAAETVVNPMAQMIQTKKEGRPLWYSGVVLVGTGALSLVAGSHFDGIAALHRNQAARYLRAGNQAEGFYQERVQMQTWLDRRNLAWQVGLGLASLGGTLMLVDLGRQYSMSFKVQNGLQVQKQF